MSNAAKEVPQGKRDHDREQDSSSAMEVPQRKRKRDRDREQDSSSGLNEYEH